MILGFADFERASLETVGFGRRSSAVAKNGTYSMEFDGDTALEARHNCISRVANNTEPLAEYPGWGWWALGGWLYVDIVPATGTISMMLSETSGNSYPKWAIGMQVSGSDYKLLLYHNKVQKGITTALTIGTWYWVVWVMNRHGQVELWVDGTKKIDVASGANAMGDSPTPSYHEVEKDGKSSVNSSWFWDSMFLQDDYGFENADTPLTLNSAGLRAPDTTTITLASNEYLRAVAPKRLDTGAGYQFTNNDGVTTWDQGYDDYKGGSSVVQGTVLGRRADQQRLVDSTANVNEGAAFAAGDTTLTVTDGTQFTVGEYIQIDNEILRVTTISTNDLTVVRGELGTADKAHADSTDVYHVVGGRWSEANYNELGWNSSGYPLIATVEEGVMDETPPTRYRGLYPG